MDEKLVRKALTALESQERQRTEAVEVLVRHLTNHTSDCQETIRQIAPCPANLARELDSKPISGLCEL